MMSINAPAAISAQDFRQRLDSPVDTEALIASLVPPPHFRDSSFGNYEPATAFASQAIAKSRVEHFTREIGKHGSGLLSRLFGRAEFGSGLYLDGGFGVGKTHLLAAAFHAFHGRKSYLSFQELMFIVGMISLSGAVDRFSKKRLLIIDEFELDDPANTRIVTNLLGQLLDAGVNIITSSNTPPGALGAGKFSVESFQRELGDLTDRFQVERIDGEDYRLSHPHPDSKGNWGLESLDPFSLGPQTLLAPFDEFLDTLATAHPMRIRQALTGLTTIALLDVHPILDAHAAVRFVYLIDKAYDNNVSILSTTNIEIRELFPDAYFQGGDTKKFLRCVSRLQELTSGPR